MKLFEDVIIIELTLSSVYWVCNEMLVNRDENTIYLEIGQNIGICSFLPMLKFLCGNLVDTFSLRDPGCAMPFNMHLLWPWFIISLPHVS
jgi:hypothetical protein